MPRPAFKKPRTIAPGLTVNKLSPAFLKLLKERHNIQDSSGRITYMHNPRSRRIPERVFRFDPSKGSLATHLFDAKTGKLVTNDLKRKLNKGVEISTMIKKSRKKKPSNKLF